MISVKAFLLGVVAFFAAGMIAETLFKKLKVPDALWLILLGAAIGPIGGFVKRSSVDFLVPYFGAVALIVILFDGGTSLSLGSLKNSAARSTLLAVSTFVASVLSIAALSWLGAWLGLISEWNWFKALMLGCILGGSSSIIIIPTVMKAQISERLSGLVSVESAITDALCIVGTSLTLGLALSVEKMGAGIQPAIGELLLKTVGYGAGIGAVAGIFWLAVQPLMKGSYNYLITLSYLFLIYVVTDALGGSPAFAILILAIILGNARWFAKALRMEGQRSISFEVNFLTDQLAFIIKVFFFILIGLLLSFSLNLILFSILITAVIIGARFFVTPLSLWKGEFSLKDKRLISVCFPRGLAAGVLATTPFYSGIKGTENLAQVVFLVVAFSTLIFSIGFYWSNRETSSAIQTPVASETNAGEEQP